jgi:hypothetical protein
LFGFQAPVPELPSYPIKISIRRPHISYSFIFRFSPPPLIFFLEHPWAAGHTPGAPVDRHAPPRHPCACRGQCAGHRPPPRRPCARPPPRHPCPLEPAPTASAVPLRCPPPQPAARGSPQSIPQVLAPLPLPVRGSLPPSPSPHPNPSRHTPAPPGRPEP